MHSLSKSITILEDKIRKIKYLRSQVVLGIDTLLSLTASTTTLIFINLLIPTVLFSLRTEATWCLGAVAASLIAFILGKSYRSIIRHSSLRELARMAVVVIGKEILLWTIMVSISIFPPLSHLLAAMIVVDALLTLCLMIMVRVMMVIAYDFAVQRSRPQIGVQRVLVYGINDKSVSTITRLHHSPNYRIEGFIVPREITNDNTLLSGLPIHKYSDANDVKSIAFATGVDGILFAHVDDARAEHDKLLEYAPAANLKTFITPGIDEMTDGQTLGNYIRKIKIEDLLGREEIKISMDDIIKNFQDKVVMVTGAAGSIGSELCRQLAGFGVKQLVLFDNAESPLHAIRLELEDTFPELDFIPVIGDVRSPQRLEFAFSRFNPQIVFHAAAYKHVPLMEENPCEAINVNVIGSRNVADMCVSHNIEKMVMVSTDKAVNPTNIMGCTKRLAEIYVQSLGMAIERGEIKGCTKFVTTRFGNVLGSNGSVIPRFREQIEHGGPITVTHPDIVRFFMTIPEACRLVMEAATFSTGTQIFVFDMGSPVKITALAEKMIRLSGLTPGRDIQISFTGLRPGEKLYEEVLATKENTIPTDHARIFVAKAREYDYNEAADIAARLGQHASMGEIPPMVILMKKTVPEFKSKHSEFEIYDIPK